MTIAFEKLVFIVNYKKSKILNYKNYCNYYFKN
jgi:hypothetical protein